jgi:protein TonB
MFEQSMVLDAGHGQKSWTFAASLAGELGAISLLALLPLLYTEALPVVQAVTLRLPSPPAPPTPRTPVSARPQTAPPSQRTGPVFQAPQRIPSKVATIVDGPVVLEGAPAVNAAGGVPGGTGDVLLNVPALTVAVPPPPTPARTDPTVPSKPIAIGGDVLLARIVKRVVPVYPPIARQARISGVVKLTGIIAKDGTIQQLQVVSGHPLLVRSALDAVRQWTYQPTLLNGQPVEVIAPIDVVFTLSQ